MRASRSTRCNLHLYELDVSVFTVNGDFRTWIIDQNEFLKIKIIVRKVYILSPVKL